MPLHRISATAAQCRVMSDIGDRRPIYRRLRDELAAEIARNTWHPGEPIPAEAEIAAKYKVAVGTARKALDLLVSDRLVERVQGSGTFVRRASFETAVVRFLRYYGSAGDRRTPGSRILKREKIGGSEAVTNALQLERGAEVIHLERLRVDEGKPVLIEDIWLNAVRFGPVLTMEECEPKLLYPIYEKLCGEIVARAEETITIGTAGSAEAKLLGLELGQPIVLLARLAFGYDDCPIEWRCSRGSGLDFHYRVEIR